ncbi:YbaB/EbfC family DNA-binding protein [Auraticoccus sp. F435]|uniref:YbaB/EbfC family DNA-binding protein n=1 Tax=Auraticoccus cholistanensis TaxID=2656650 RepID=A0A6A9UVN7_9ACTN|nr:YbaB/EbfC family DNA-binding protein [Auraticoccus cholistanensis]MVA76758.1 YbaB/EbfC family DNA-binding protein [Auraticoccus cholistanensis]
MTDGFEDVLRRLDGRLTEVVEGREDLAEGVQLAEVRGVGEAADGRIRAVMAGGTFTELTIEPAAHRMSHVELAEAVLEAVNAAAAEHARLLTEAVQAADSTDLGRLQGDLRQLQSQSLTAMRTYTESLFDALAQARRLAGDPAPER